MFLSTRSPTLLALLLLMATLQSYLLHTEQSSLVQSLGHHLSRPSMAKASDFISVNRTLQSSDADWQRCKAYLSTNQYAYAALTECNAYQAPWIMLINLTRKDHNEFVCNQLYCNNYCFNLVASAYCLPQDYKEFQNVLKVQFERPPDGRTNCRDYQDWTPPLDAPPNITNQTIACGNTLANNGASKKCAKQVDDKIGFGHIHDEPIVRSSKIEQMCMGLFELKRCITVEACKSCSTKSANKYLNFYASVWSPANVECNQWASQKPTMECTGPNPNDDASTGGPVIPFGNLTVSPLLQACLLVLGAKGEDTRCEAEAVAKYPNGSLENECKAGYYLGDCAMKAACKLCSDTKDFADNAREVVEMSREKCKEWSSDEPKLECSSNILLIVGIVIVVIVVILVVIGVAICCLCFTSPEKTGPSSSKNNKRSKPKGSSRNKAGSSMGAKQTSRAAAAGSKKMSSRASGDRKKKQSKVSKGAKPQSRVKQSKRSRASTLK